MQFSNNIRDLFCLRHSKHGVLGFVPLECNCKNYETSSTLLPKQRELFGPEKPFIQLRPTYSVKLVFSYVVKGIKFKMTAKIRDTEHLRFEHPKRIMSAENFRDFRETGRWS